MVGGLAGFALASLGTGFAVAMVPGLRSAPALAGNPLVWALGSAPLVIGSLGWMAGKRRAELERSNRSAQRGIEAKLAQLTDAEWVTRSLVNAAFDPMLVVDDDDIVTAANHQAARMFGVPQEVLVGRVVTSLLPDAPALVQRTAGGESVPVQVRHADGGTVGVEFRSAAIPNPQMVLITLREDAAGAELVASRRAADQQVERALQEARARAQALREVDLGLRHDVERALLAIDALRAKAVPVGSLLATVWSMLDRLERLLDLATWDRAALPPELSSTSVVDLFDHAIRLVSPLARRWDRAVLVDLEPGLSSLRTDPALVAAAVRALVREALTRGVGDVVLEVVRQPGRDHDWLLVSVALGVAVSSEDAEATARLLESAPPTLPEGSDAGLALGQRVARRLGGRITLRSEVRERGTTFGFVLPLTVPGRVTHSKPPPGRSSIGS